MDRISQSFRSRSYGKLRPADILTEPPKKKTSHKACIIIASSSIILLAVTACLVFGLLHSRNKHSSSSSSSSDSSSVASQSSIAIKSFCQESLFPDTCLHDISTDSSSISANPRQLVSLGIKAALLHVQNFSQYASALAQHAKGLEKAASEDCLQLFDDAKDQLNASIFQLSNLKVSSLSQQLNDVKVWLSSSLSYQTACTDGFFNQSGNITNLMLDHQENVFRSLSNSLSLVDILSKLQKHISDDLPSLHFRRLLEDKEATTDSDLSDLPDWVSSADRKLLQAGNANATNVVVAKDGSGSFTAIQAAVNAIPTSYTGRYVINIKKGIYNEIVTVNKKQPNVLFVGDGIGVTIITGNLNVAGSPDTTTFRSATVAITGQGFMARGITFQNTAGPSGHQAVALRIGGDHAIFQSCSFEGYQDTLYALSGRQFYRDCVISGTVDYIFGNAIAVFQKCKLVARQPLPSQKNTYTAQGRKVASDPSGYSFQDCTFTGEAGLQPSIQTFLGRPWKAYSRTVILKSQLDALIDPSGWLPWEPTNAFGNTVYYGEYGNTGAASSIAKRVTWGGVHPSMTLAEAQQFGVNSFISGSTWLTADNVEFDASVPQ